MLSMIDEQAVRSLQQDMSMSMMSFSMPLGSFKKVAVTSVKGASKTVKGASKGLKGCPPTPKSLKEPKEPPLGKDKVHSLKAPKHVMECEEPIHAPAPAATPSAPTTNIPMPSTPTAATSPSTVPTLAGLDTVVPSSISTTEPSSGSAPTSSEAGPIAATPYRLSYTLELRRIPIDTDYVGVTEITDSFVNEQMARNFPNGSAVKFLYSNTTRDSFSFVGPNEPVNITFTTEVTIDPASDTSPTVDELDALLLQAFSNPELDTYLADLAALPASNIFQTTTAVAFETIPATTVTDASDGSVFETMSAATIGGIAAAGAGILIVLAGTIFALRKSGDSDSDGHDAIKFVDIAGGVTVTDDTYAGSTCAGTSMDAGSTQNSVGWSGLHSQFSAQSYRTQSPTEVLERSDSDIDEDDSPEEE
ncbi:hypothetical protein MPSEU_000150400 [Mayamaea pseudoterrestris]|nr:hypothetical protein MPSEU_000150400 [Mayamaea pseudoterrestris]